MSTVAETGPPPSRIIDGLPPFGRGQRIGLYGGSFNPPHDGHRQIALIAMHRLQLDAVWWLVSPGNPLKDNGDLQSQQTRMEQTAALAAHPRMPVSNLETVLKTRYTADLAEKLMVRAGHARFVWIMGSDNLATFHLWDRWRDIAAMFPIAVINRPGTLTAPLNAPAAHYLASSRIGENAARSLAAMRPPAWTFLTGPRTPASSSAIRQTLTAHFKNNW